MRAGAAARLVDQRAPLRVVPGSKPRRVFGYARVSSQEQARGSSLGDQQTAIGAFATKLGCAVAHFYVEAESAVHEKIERREQIRALLAEVREGDLIVCDKLDRWSRDPEFTYGSIRQILAAGAAFYAVGDQCDPSTRDGDTMLGVRVLVAREEHKRIKERMVGTRKLLRDRGYYSEGLPPFGYRRSLGKGEKGPHKNDLVVDDAKAAIVRDVFRLSIAGRSLNQIAAAVGLRRDRVRSVLGSRVYLGEVRDSRGEWIKGRHPALIEADTFTRAKDASARRRLGGARPRGRTCETSDWILRDVATCAGCGARMSAAYAGTPAARRYYYRCSHSCSSRYVAVRAIELEAEPLIVARLEELREELAREPAGEPAATPNVAELVERRARLGRKRQRLLEAFADEHMTRDELREAMGRLDGELLRLDAEEAAGRRQSPLADPAARRAALRELGAIRRAWTSATPAAKRQITSHLVVAVHLVAGAAPVFSWRSAEELAEVVGA